MYLTFYIKGYMDIQTPGINFGIFDYGIYPLPGYKNYIFRGRGEAAKIRRSTGIS
jgi:hypothetical protein